MLKRGLLLFSIILITVGVGLCGCMSSNGSGSSKTIGGLEKVEVANTQKVETTPLSNTVKVKVGDKEIEMSKSDYDALTKHIVPDWFIIRLGRDLHVSKDKIEEVLQHKKEASEDTIIMIPTHLGDVEGIYGYVYEDGRFVIKGGRIGLIDMPSNKTFMDFAKINGVNYWEMNLSKYKKQYDEYMKVRKDLEKWFNNTVKGKLTVVSGMGTYTKNLNDSLDVYMLKHGWAFMQESFGVEYNGTTPVNLYDKNKNPQAYWYEKLRIDAQLYAEKHKLGIWAINFNES